MIDVTYPQAIVIVGSFFIFVFGIGFIIWACSKYNK